MVLIRTLTGKAALTACILTIGAAFSTASQAATDLLEVYQHAKNYDTTIQAAGHDYDAAIQRLPIARSAFRPQLNLGADGSRISADTNLGDDDYYSGALSLSLSQTLYNRSNSKLISQAKIGVMQADTQFLALQQQLILRAATAYFNVLRAQANLEFSQSELEAIGRQREQAERRFDVGLVPITDVLSAQAQSDLAAAQEIAANNELSTAREALLLISGIEADSLAALADDFPLTSPDPANIDAWVDLASEQNLELVGARLAADSARSEIAVQRAARYPSLSAMGIAAKSETGRKGGADAEQGEIRLEARLPILSGGLTKARVAQAHAQSLSANEQLISQERSTVQQARDSYRGVLANISRVGALNKALKSTKKSAEAAEAGFRAGTRTSVEVLEALRDVFSARSNFSSARYDYVINMLNLKAAAGTLDENDITAINQFLTSPE